LADICLKAGLSQTFGLHTMEWNTELPENIETPEISTGSVDPKRPVSSLILARRQEAAQRKQLNDAQSISRPLPKDVPDTGYRSSLATRVQALTLMAEGYPTRIVEAKTGMSQRAQSTLKKKAIARGFDPAVDPRILQYYVEDGYRSGRPHKAKGGAGVEVVEVDAEPGSGDITPGPSDTFELDAELANGDVTPDMTPGPSET
jgi:hypothetical protein